MLLNYFKTAWRVIWRNKQFSALNLIGLTTGLTCSLLIFLWIRDERKMNHLGTNGERVYQVLHNIVTSDGIETIENTPGILAKSLATDLPEVTFAASVIPSTWFSKKGVIHAGDKQMRTNAQFVSDGYFEIFPLHFIDGTKTNLFDGYQHVALSTSLADRLFGTTLGIVGKTIEWKQEGFSGTYRVCGIFEIMENSAAAPFDLLLNYELFLEKNPKLQQWGNSDPNTYVLLKNGVDAMTFNQKIAGYLKSKNEKTKSTLFAQLFRDRYLHNQYVNGLPAGGRIEYVHLFLIIAIFILLMACINFINLSTAGAASRLKETGIKKVMGASRGRLILQFISETLLISFLGMLLALSIAYFLLPYFNMVTGKAIVLEWNFTFIAIVLLFVLITGLLAGSYPAWYISGFHPIDVLKGKLPVSLSELIARKGLVTFQFTLSIFLIVSVTVIYRQVQFVQNKNLGYDRTQVLYFESGQETTPDHQQALASLLQQVRAVPGVLSASNFRHTITNRHGGTTDVTWPGKDPNNKTEFTDIAAGYEFIETLGISMKEGRTFSRDFGGDQKTVILNESAVLSMGLDDPIGKTINIWGEDKQIIGVTNDFHFASLYESVKPCFFDFNTSPRASKIMVRIDPADEHETIAALEVLYNQIFGEPLEYTFLDTEYQQLYASENRVAVLSRYFTSIAVLLSCLGVFGLATFTSRKRQKEVGIRKILGASSGRVAFLLTADFIRLLFIGVIIAIPVSWWALNEWLQDFAYRVGVSWDVFIIASVSMLVITLLSTSYQAITTAFSNPVNSLRKTA